MKKLKRKLACVIGCTMLIAQMPTTYVNAMEMNIAQEIKAEATNQEADDSTTIETTTETDTTSKDEANEVSYPAIDATSLMPNRSSLEAQKGTADADGFVIENGVLTGYSGSEEVITIPSGVTSIGGGAFHGCTSITNVTIPEGVTSIGVYAFAGCSNLTIIDIPSSVTSIGERAFIRCNKLADNLGFVIVKNVLYDYFGDISVTVISVPEGVTRIETSAFENDSSLVSITIPNGVTSIGAWAFYKCSSLTSISIPNSVTSIGARAFASCSSLTSITIPSSVTSIGSSILDNCDYSKLTIYCNKDSAFYQYIIENNISATVVIMVDSVCLNESNLNLNVGQTTTLTATILPDSANNKNITWSTSDSKIAAVDNTGKVTAVSAGTAVIKVTTQEGNKTASCTINVKQETLEPEKPASPKSILVKRIKLSTIKATLGKKASIQLRATIAPNNATNKTIVWTSSNTKVAIVSATGKVTAKAAGTVLISATAKDGSNVAGSCKITVSKKKSYKITYKLKKGKNADTNPTYYASGVKVSLANPTRKGYTFAGWYQGKSKISSIRKNTTGKITLTARWNKTSVDKTTVKSVKNKNAGQLSISFDKVKQAKGYTVYYSTNKKLTNTTTVDLTSKKKIATIKKLKKGTTYFVTVKAYKTDSLGNRVYGKSNKTFKVKLKK